MSDRELLEFAAKAAGYANAKYQDLRGWGEVRYGLTEAIWTGEGYWNPIADDGDALRLMVRLRLEPRFLDNSHSNGAEPSRVTLHNFAGIVENIDGDPLAATRRAIVRAAAEIGRQMP